MLHVIKGLPFKLRNKWRTVACDVQERCGRRAMFADIVNFIEVKQWILYLETYRTLQHEGTTKETGRTKSIPRSKVRGNSFATNVTAFKRTQPDNKNDGPQKSCLSCKNNGHRTESCTLLERKAHSEKMNFLKTNGVCFGCLCSGHISKECMKRLFLQNMWLTTSQYAAYTSEGKGRGNGKGQQHFRKSSRLCYD